MIAFANPVWLYGLFGLLVPIGIHLLSRKEGKTIYMGSIRHLTDSDTAQFSSIRLNEILLLIVRLILITLLVFLLAGFHLRVDKDESKQWLVIEKGIEINDEYRALMDSVTAKGFEVHWLSQHFPAYEDSSNAVAPDNYYSLINDLRTTGDTAIVLSHNFAHSFRGETIPVPANIRWMVVDAGEKEIVIDAITKGDSIQTRIARSSSLGTSLSYSVLPASQWSSLKKRDSLTTRNVDTTNVTIYSLPEFEYDKKIIQAVLHALAQQTGQRINIETTTDSTSIAGNADFVFWLSSQNYSGDHSNVFGLTGCRVSNLPLLVSHDEEVSHCGKSSFHWIITQRLNEENVLAETLTVSLARVMFQDHPLYAKIDSREFDQRSVPLEAAFSPAKPVNKKSVVENQAEAGTEPTLYLLLFLFLVAERLIAFKRNQ